MRMSPETVRRRSLTGRRSPLAAASVGDGRLTLPLIVEISGSTRMPVGSPRRTSPDTVRIATDAPVYRRIVTSPLAVSTSPSPPNSSIWMSPDASEATRRPPTLATVMSPDVARKSAAVAHDLEPRVSGGECDVGAHDVVGADVTGRRAHAQRAERAAGDDVDGGALDAHVGADRHVDREPGRPAAARGADGDVVADLA